MNCSTTTLLSFNIVILLFYVLYVILSTVHHWPMNEVIARERPRLNRTLFRMPKMHYVLCSVCFSFVFVCIPLFEAKKQADKCIRSQMACSYANCTHGNPKFGWLLLHLQLLLLLLLLLVLMVVVLVVMVAVVMIVPNSAIRDFKMCCCISMLTRTHSHTRTQTHALTHTRKSTRQKNKFHK